MAYSIHGIEEKKYMQRATTQAHQHLRGEVVHLLLAVTVMLSISLAPRVASAQLFRALFVFGDSLSDTGNVFSATQAVSAGPIPVSPPYFNGRFSNGPVWIEGLAQTLNLALTPFLDGGTNSAYGGAEIGLETEEIFERDIGVIIPSIRSQVQTFLAADFFGVEEVDPAALYVLWGGANDLRDALQSSNDPVAEARGAVEDLAATIKDLADAGAVYFLVPNLPNLGRTPESLALGDAEVARATEVSQFFNDTLAATLDTLESENRLVIFRLNTFTHLEDIIANPAAFGFTNVTDACLDGDPFTGGNVCADPATHLFWDSIHPTQAAHALLATFAAQALPLLTAMRDDNNPTAVDVSGAGQNLPVLQVRLGTGTEIVHLTHVSVDFTTPVGPASQVQHVRVQLINDANANGQFDAAETILATAESAGVVASIPLEVTPPLDIAAISTAHLVVLLDINSPAAGVAMRARQTPSATITRTAWLAALLPGLGLLCLPWQQRQRRSRWLSAGIFLLCCSLMLTSCDIFDDDDNSQGNNTLTFRVSIPAEGMTGQGDVSGPLTAPAISLPGASVSVTPR
jgi:outer membrane lipase/esterase